MVHFVGAGPGAPDLITLRGAEHLCRADMVIYAGSLVNPELLQLTREGCEIYDSASMTLEEVIEKLQSAHERGLDAVRPFVKRFWKKRSLQTGAARRDAKTELQEWAHQQGNVHPAYSIISRTGPDHDPLFMVEVTVKGFAAETGEGRSKRIAEQHAAEAMLYREGVWKRDNSA